MDNQTSTAELAPAPARRAGRQWLRPEQKKNCLVGVPMNERMLENIDRYRATLDEDVSRPHVIRMIISNWLRENQLQD